MNNENLRNELKEVLRLLEEEKEKSTPGRKPFRPSMHPEPIEQAIEKIKDLIKKSP
jgi:hypothetical protein